MEGIGNTDHLLGRVKMSIVTGHTVSKGGWLLGLQHWVQRLRLPAPPTNPSSFWCAKVVGNEIVCFCVMCATRIARSVHWRCNLEIVDIKKKKKPPYGRTNVSCVFPMDQFNWNLCHQLMGKACILLKLWETQCTRHVNVNHGQNVMKNKVYGATGNWNRWAVIDPDTVAAVCAGIVTLLIGSLHFFNHLSIYFIFADSAGWSKSYALRLLARARCAAGYGGRHLA